MLIFENVIAILIVLGIFCRQIKELFLTTTAPWPEESESSSPSSCHSTENGEPQFDVFLSFNGEDSRKSFAKKLRKILKEHGVSTFIYVDDKLEEGAITKRLFDHIERSKVCVPIFLKGYADSEWCLKEISKMVECEKVIVPVFFDDKPCGIGRNGDRLASVIEGHEECGQEKELVNKWMNAMKKVGDISSYNLKHSDRNEAKILQVIVKKILSEINPCHFDMTEEPIGFDSPINEILNLLDLGADEFRMVGIHGTGGVGKTTLAKAVFNKIQFQFEACSFIENVREVSKSKGLESIQAKLLKDIFWNAEDLQVDNVSNGKKLIKQAVCGKSMLIVLDDIDDKIHLDSLIGCRDWFSKRSRVIVTARSKKTLLLHRIKEEDTYQLRELNDDYSFQLFSYHAFRRSEVLMEKFAELSKRVVSSTRGLPLVIEVLGAHCFDLRTEKEWEDMLKTLKQFHPEDIHERLKLSFDKLDGCEKQAFIDIACFLIGWNQKEAIQIWNTCRVDPVLAIKMLEHKALLKVRHQYGHNGEMEEVFEMHDQIRDIGRRILLNEMQLIPGAMMWGEHGSFPFGTHAMLKLEERAKNQRAEFHWDSKASSIFENMSSLRILHLDSVCFRGEHLYLPPTLKWFRLSACEFESVSYCNLEEIITLELFHADGMPELLIQQCSVGDKVLRNMKVLTICSVKIRTTPDFSSIPFLEKLTLANCVMLAKVHESIGCLKSLEYLNMSKCRRLVGLPETICQLSSLEILELGQCSKFCSLPEQLGAMKSLKVINCDETKVRKVPASIGQLTNLRKLSMRACKIERLPSSMRNLDSLQTFCIKDNPLKGIDSLSCLDDMMSIDELYASSCELLAALPDKSCQRIERFAFTNDEVEELPDSVKRLKKLDSLVLACSKLKALPHWLGSFENLTALEVYCENLTVGVEVMHLKSVQELTLRCFTFKSLCASTGVLENLMCLTIACVNLKALPVWIGSLNNLEILTLEGCESIERLPDFMEEMNIFYLNISGTRINEIPHHLGCIQNLRVLEISNTPKLMLPSDLSHLTSLEELVAENCKWMDSGTHHDQAKLPLQLKTLNFRENNFSSLPSCISSLFQLQHLNLDGCRNLESIPQLPSSLIVLYAPKCTNLKRISDVSNLKSLKSLDLSDCNLLEDISGLENIANNLVSLRLPGPYSSGEFSSFNDDFITKVFKAVTFECLGELEISGSWTPGFQRNIQNLSFMFPCNEHLMVQWLVVDCVLSPIHIAVIDGDRVVFKTIREADGNRIYFEEGDEIHGYLKQGFRELQVSVDASQLTKVELSFNRRQNEELDGQMQCIHELQRDQVS